MLVTAIIAMGLNVIFGLAAIGIVLANMDSRFPGEIEIANANGPWFPVTERSKKELWNALKGVKTVETKTTFANTGESSAQVEILHVDQIIIMDQEVKTDEETKIEQEI